MSGRNYASPVRDAQVVETRARILDATIEVLGDGIAALTIPAVAERAGVSVPTVYRYFSDKETLIDATADHVRTFLGVAPNSSAITDVDHYLDYHREMFRRLERVENDTVGALLATFGRGESSMDLEGRREWHGPIFDGLIDEWPEVDRYHLLNLVSILGSSLGATTMRQFGITGDDAADLMAWLISKLLASGPTQGASQ